MKDTKKTLSNNIETVASSFPTVAKRIREDCNILLEEKEEQLTATGTALKSYKAENKELKELVEIMKKQTFVTEIGFDNKEQVNRFKKYLK